MSRFVNTPHGRADPDDPPFTVRTAGASRPPRESAAAATSAVRALDMSAADHTPGASGSAATAAEPAPETTTPTPSTPLLFTANHNRAPKPMNISAKAAQDPNARTGKVVFQDIVQEANRSTAA